MRAVGLGQQGWLGQGWLGQQGSQAVGWGSTLCRAKYFYDLSLTFFDTRN